VKRSDREKWAERAVALGAKAAKIVPADSVKTAEWVRMKCRYGCGGYGGCLTCPPHSPTPQETARVLGDYAWAVLFETGRGGRRELAATLEREIFLAGYYKAFAMASGPCGLCDACDFENGCRHPEQARPAMEACGIDVFETVRRNGFTIEVLTDTSQKGHYFGMVLIE
jgi:predicted metal-binding protein